MNYEAYGAEIVEDSVLKWRNYKVLMVGNKGENTFIKICLPLDESEPALASENDESCKIKAKLVDEEKQKNEEYINKIRSNSFFKKTYNSKERPNLNKPNTIVNKPSVPTLENQNQNFNNFKFKAQNMPFANSNQQNPQINSGTGNLAQPNILPNANQPISYSNNQNISMIQTNEVERLKNQISYLNQQLFLKNQQIENILRSRQPPLQQQNMPYIANQNNNPNNQRFLSQNNQMFKAAPMIKNK